MSSGEKEAQAQSPPGENQGGTEEEETMQVGRRGADKKPIRCSEETSFGCGDGRTKYGQYVSTAYDLEKREGSDETCFLRVLGQA